MIFCAFGLAGLATWHFGSNSRKATPATRVHGVPEATVGAERLSPPRSAWKPSETVFNPQDSSTSPTSQVSESDENAIYASVAEEIESRKTNRGLWTRLYAECDGDEKKTEVRYIKERAAQLIAAENAKRTAQVIATNEASDPLPLASAETQPSPKKFGSLTAEKVEYLVYPILSVKYLEKYGVTKDALANACAKKKLKSAWDGDVLWVQDLPINRSLAGNVGHSSEFSMQDPVQFRYQANYWGLKVFAAFLIFVALAYGAVNLIGSQHTKVSEFFPVPTSTSYPASVQRACIQIDNPSVADLCSIHSDANEYCKGVILSVLEYKGYPSLIQGCPQVKVINTTEKQVLDFASLPLIHPGNFIELPQVDAVVRESLGNDYSRFLKVLGVGSPVQKSGRNYFGTACLAHACGVEEAAFDLSESGQFFGTLFTLKGNSTVFEHFGNGFISFDQAAWMSALSADGLTPDNMPRNWGNSSLEVSQRNGAAYAKLSTKGNNCTGNFEGFASSQKGILTINDSAGRSCKLAVSVNGQKLRVLESPSCSEFRGFNCSFNGLE